MSVQTQLGLQIFATCCLHLLLQQSHCYCPCCCSYSRKSNLTFASECILTLEKNICLNRYYKVYLVNVTTFGRVIANSLQYFLFVAKVSFFHLILVTTFYMFSKTVFVIFFVCVVFPSYQCRDMSFFCFYNFFFLVNSESFF